MINISDWPGRFVRSCVSGEIDDSFRNVISSPLLWLTALIAYAVALPGIGSTVSWTDSGELMTSAYTLGISHPTGYPLFTIISRVVLILLPWLDPVSLLHHLSAGFVALAAGIISLLVVLWISSMRHTRDQTSAIVVSGMTGGILFVTTTTVWQQAVAYEVYGFQMFLYASSLFALTMSLRGDGSSRSSMTAWWPMTGLLVGFAFANHMMTLYLVPAFVWLIWKKGGMPTLRRVMAFIVPAACGGSAYAYVFLRSGSDPFLNWGDPSTVSTFLAHITGKQYQIWMFSGTDAFMKAAQAFAVSLPEDAGWITLVLAWPGAVLLWKKERDLFWFSGILLSFTLLYSFNYDIHDIQTYYLLVYMVIAIIAALGIWRIISAWSVRRPERRIMMFIFPMVVVLVNGGLRYEMFEPVDRTSPEPFARDVLLNAGRHATIITGAWDFLYSPIMALQSVQGIRQDVLMIDLHLLRDRSWYVRALLDRHMAHDENVRRQGEAFVRELVKFESGLPFDQDAIGLQWQKFLEVLLQSAEGRGPLYADHEVIRELPAGRAYQPEGYLLRSYRGDDNPAYTGIPVFHPIGNKNDDLAQYYLRFCSTAFLNHAIFARSISDSVSFAASLERARIIDPANPLLAAFLR